MRWIAISESSVAARPSELSIVDLDLGGAALADALAAGRDHVLHRGAADRAGALLAERPEHRVGDVRLAGAVGADDHADARRELQLRPLGERLEPLHLDRSQIHALVLGPERQGSRLQSDATAPSSPPSRSSACSAAACSAAFLLRPLPVPTRSESTIAATSKVRRCGGPGFADHLVAYARAAPRQQLLQRRLEVDRRLERVLDPGLEGVAPRRRRRGRSRRRGSRRRSAPRSPPAAAASRRAGPRPGSPSSSLGLGRRAASPARRARGRPRRRRRR